MHRKVEVEKGIAHVIRHESLKGIVEIAVLRVRRLLNKVEALNESKRIFNWRRHWHLATSHGETLCSIQNLVDALKSSRLHAHLGRLKRCRNMHSNLHCVEPIRIDRDRLRCRIRL